MEFTGHNLRESHEAHASATITESEPMQDITTRWAGNRYETVGVPFQPDRAMFSWRWAGALGWVLTQMKVSGYQIKKDGSAGLKTRRVEFIRKGEVVGSTPSELLKLAEELAPKTKIVQP